MVVFQVAIFQGPCILIECVAVNVTFLLIVFKEGTDKIFVAADSHASHVTSMFVVHYMSVFYNV